MEKMIKELRNNYDYEISFTDLEEAKKYYMPNLFEFPEEKEYAEEIKNADSLEELARVLNRYTDIFDNGSSWFVKEF